MYRKIIICTLALSLFACKYSDKQKEDYIKRYLGKELKLEAKYYSYCSNSQKYDTIFITNNTLKVVSYFNTDVCMSCIDELQLWSPIIREFENDTTIMFVFIIKTDEHRFNHHIKPYLKSWGNNLRVCLDTTSNFQEKNDVSDEHFFNTYLLDKDNNTILVGNPLFNDDLIQLYKDKFKNHENNIPR